LKSIKTLRLKPPPPLLAEGSIVQGIADISDKTSLMCSFVS
jgi:hypothetical protein